MKNYILAMVIAMAVTTPAQASYLHVRQAHRAAQHWLPWWAGQLEGRPGSIGACHHANAHRVVCIYTVLDATIDSGTMDWQSTVRVTLRHHKVAVRDVAFR